MRASTHTRIRAAARTAGLLLVVLLATCAMAAATAGARTVAEVPFTTCASFGTVPVTSTSGTPTCVQNTCSAIMTTSTGSDAACTEPQQTTLVDDVPTYSVAATGAALNFTEPVDAPADAGWTQILLGIGLGALLLAIYIWAGAQAPADGRARTSNPERPKSAAGRRLRAN
ncbi:MAG: hypothetical protein JWM90_2073 [Thermoleophilia bacterium]|nr:hypothetical protein [Thermoleophilia bacterium]